MPKRYKPSEKRPCPWCGRELWQIILIEMYQTYYFRCHGSDCGVNGPQRPTEAEAEAAIFERVK